MLCLLAKNGQLLQLSVNYMDVTLQVTGLREEVSFSGNYMKLVFLA